jgi:hypothetical protein
MAYYEDLINKVLREAENVSSDKLEVVFNPEKFHIKESMTGSRFFGEGDFIEANITLSNGRLIETSIGAYWDGKIKLEKDVELSNDDKNILFEAAEKIDNVYKEAMLILKENNGVEDMLATKGQANTNIDSAAAIDINHIQKNGVEAPKSDSMGQVGSKAMANGGDGDGATTPLGETIPDNKGLNENINISCKDDFVKYIGAIHNTHASLNKPLSERIYKGVMAGRITPAEASLIYEDEMEMPERLSEQVGVILTKLQESGGKLEAASFPHETETFPIPEPAGEANTNGVKDVNHIQKNGAEAPKEDSFDDTSLFNNTGRWKISRTGKLERDLS